MQKNSVYDSLNTRGITADDVFNKINKSVKANITIPIGVTLNPGDPLVTTDGGKTFTPAFIAEYDDTKTDYAIDTLVVDSEIIYKALVANPAADTLSDDTKWNNEGAYEINGAAMITFKREVPSTASAAETLSCAVAVDCELAANTMVNFNESSRVAGFPNILMR